MAHRDLRELLAVLEQRGRLRRVAKPVDRDWELACMARWMFQALDEKDRFGLLFENVTGFDVAVATGIVGSSREAYAIALGVEPGEINDRWVAALRQPVVPRRVETAPSQEVVLRGGDADIGRFPVPVWTPGKDAAPYISCPVVTSDRETGIYNVGVYRTMVRDATSLIVNFGPHRHGGRCSDTWLKAGKPAPIAWVIGAEPAVAMASVANVAYDVDEFAIAGGLTGEPVEMVPAASIDLMVPANAEIVIEAEIHPGETGEEGPFGEFAGFMGEPSTRPLAKITAITHRRDPIYYGFISQMPPSESTTIQSIGYAGTILKQLRHDFRYETVQDVFVDYTFGGSMAHGIIALKSMYPGHARQVGRLVADATNLKRVTVVDDDIDIRDPVHLAWAMNSRFRPAPDTIVIDDVYGSRNMDPTLETLEDGTIEPTSKIVCDATRSRDSGPLSLPSKELMERALESWREADLPEFDIPDRVRLMLEGS